MIASLDDRCDGLWIVGLGQYKAPIESFRGDDGFAIDGPQLRQDYCLAHAERMRP